MKNVLTVSYQIINIIILNLVLISGLNISAIAQDDFKLPQLVPPSPNASSLGVYGDIPVDKSTGVPNITIPLYTIIVDDISVPISLSFHASGHKVGSRASWVGLGWTLNAGGVVTRSMRGKPDESGYFYNMADVKSWEDNDLLPIVYESITSTSDQAIIDLKNSMWDFYSLNHDVQADLFFYNFPGGAGKFSFNYDQTIIDFPYQDLSIEPISLTISNVNGTGEISGFEIIDQQGIIYLFDEEEETIVDYPSDYLHLDTERYTSSWYLTSILSQRSSKEVNFTYSDYINLFDDAIQNSIYRETKPDDGSASLNIQNSVSTTIALARYLEVISWEGGEIFFHKTGGRQDLDGGQQLDYIEIFDSFGALIKSIHFSYEDFHGGLSALNKNLRLMSVEEHAANGQANPPYIFEYYTGVPARDSKAMDHFGYYNEQNNNSTLVPPFMNFSGVIYDTGADRDAGNATSVCGMLKTIQYPTGGSSEFLYEANDCLSNHVPISQLTQGTVATHVEKCDANGLLYIDQSGQGIIGLICSDTDVASITIPANARQTLLSIAPTYDPANPPAISADDEFYVRVYSVEQSTETLVLSYNSLEDFSVQDFLLSGAEYRIESSTDIIGTGILARITYWHDDSSNPGFSNIITGGIRIASIKQYDDISVNPVKVTNYIYTLQNDPLLSSGVLLSSAPKYSKGVYQNYVSGLDGFDLHSIHYANPIGLLGSLNGSHIIYGEVVELEEGNGWTRSIYSTDTDVYQFIEYGINDVLPSSVEKVSAFWKRGLPLETKVFNEAGSLIGSSENHYTNIVKDTSHSFVFEPYIINGVVFPLWNRFKFAINRQVSGWARLDSTIERDYAEGVELFKTIEYSYATTIPSELGLILPTEVAYDLNSDLNYSITTNYLNDRDNHIISPVVNKSTFNHADQLRYSLDNFYSSSVKLYEKQMKNKDGDIIRTVNYAHYNGLKPSEIIDSNGTTISYIWGYDQTLPVAKIINATRAEIEALPGFGPGFNAGTGALSQAQEDSLRALLPKAMVTTFTYKRLVGMSSQTDPNGLITKYNYDNFNRLEFIEDHDGNIVSKVEYHFK